jgi:glutamyl-Q tRNA(Asp) synthetase
VSLKTYRGRFAPSPSGELHFGSLLAAMASFADARSKKGQWLVRIDDIDTPRVIPGSADHILNSLEQCGFEWDESASYQSDNLDDYQEALHYLSSHSRIYPCTCSRKQIKVVTDNGIYPGTCRNRSLSAISPVQPHSIRINVQHARVAYKDLIQQTVQQDLESSVGDFIIFRRDRIFTYQLSVVVDDFISRITHVIRGYDLLASTPRQIYLQQQLNYCSPEYGHIPLAVTANNLKLSKMSHARKISCDLKTLVLAAQFLGQKVLPEQDYEHKADFWAHLFSIWDINRVPKMEKQQIMY